MDIWVLQCYIVFLLWLGLVMTSILGQGNLVWGPTWRTCSSPSKRAIAWKPPRASLWPRTPPLRSSSTTPRMKPRRGSWWTRWGNLTLISENTPLSYCVCMCVCMYVYVCLFVLDGVFEVSVGCGEESRRRDKAVYGGMLVCMYVWP